MMSLIDLIVTVVGECRSWNLSLNHVVNHVVCVGNIGISFH